MPENEPKFLTVLPVFNEVKTVNVVLDLVAKNAQEVLVVEDGSSDGTAEILAARDDIIVLAHEVNRGYGAALISGFDYAIEHGYVS